jgi:hypothetical protein
MYLGLEMQELSLKEEEIDLVSKYGYHTFVWL